MRNSKSIENLVKILVLIFMAIVISVCKEQPKKLISIEELKGPDWQKYVGKSVTIEAIFVQDPIPMLVTDLKMILANLPMQADKYIILEFKEGEGIDPQKYGGAKLKVSGIINVLKDKKRYVDENIALSAEFYEISERPLEIYNPLGYTVDTLIYHALSRRYAVLFSGGISAIKNHIRYWNDLKFMYSTLVNKYGYTDKGIYVLYADGVGRDTQMPVDYSATKTNLEKVFDELEDKTTSLDLIFFFTTNHGGGFWPIDYLYSIYMYGEVDTDGDEGEEPIYESIYTLDFNGDGDQTDQIACDEVLNGWGNNVLDNDFYDMFKDLKYDKMVIVMEQCFSGGLIYDMVEPCNNRILMSAAGQYEPSWSMSNGSYDEFSYYFTCAINGADPNGNIVNADTDGDGKISMVEAFNYARTSDSKDETPMYDDNGDGVPHSGNMPACGEGVLGDNTFLN